MVIKDGDFTLFSWDPVTGRSIWKYFDGQQTHIRTDYPVDNILKENEALFAESQNERFGEYRRIASIPLNIYYDELETASAENDEKYMSRWLNDSDNRAFRTFRGSV